MNSAATTSVTTRTLRRTISSMTLQRKKGMTHWRLKLYSSFKRPTRLSSGVLLSVLASHSIDILGHVTWTQQLIGSLWCPSSVFSTCGSLTEFRNLLQSMAPVSLYHWQRETNITQTPIKLIWRAWRPQSGPSMTRSHLSFTILRLKPWMNFSATFRITYKIDSAPRTSLKTQCCLNLFSKPRNSLISWLKLRWCNYRCSRRISTGGSWQGRPWILRGYRNLLIRYCRG